MYYISDMGINIRAKLSFSKYFYANFKMNSKQIEKCNIIHLKKDWGKVEKTDYRINI